MGTTTKPLTALQAAQKVAKKMKEKYGELYDFDNCFVWNQQEAAEKGWGTGNGPQICFEEGPFEWTYEMVYKLYGEEQPFEGVFIEPYNGFILCFYKEA